MVISHDLLREIDAKKNKIENSPGYYLKRSHQLRKDHRNLCDVHSFWLENPALRARILRDHKVKDPRKLRQIAREGVRKISSAWTYLNSKEVGSDYVNYMTPATIIEVGRLIEPDLNEWGYRSERATLHMRYVPPNALKVPELVDQFCQNLVDSDLHPVEAAVTAHFEIAKIQPFADGNKRVARLIQDKILWDYKLPPAFIPSGERTVYLDLWEQALMHNEAHQIKYQRPFFDYVAGKVNTALDDILGDLKV